MSVVGGVVASRWWFLRRLLLVSAPLSESGMVV
jgi:hypothetical protein